MQKLIKINFIWIENRIMNFLITLKLDLKSQYDPDYVIINLFKF